jgi:formylglycine-generating enzyme required for sulfatase activity
MPPYGEVVRLVRVFVSSPGDVKDERAELDEVVQRINATTGSEKRVRLELFKWERNVVPQIGPPAQTVVDEQTPAYDIYLGILAHRFGTPTGQYGSGTEDEFRDALQKWATFGTPWILFYFDDGPVNPSQLDLVQYGKVRDFRDELEARGLYATYQGVRGTPEAFFDKVEQHLRLVLQRIPALEQEGSERARSRPPQGMPLAVPSAYRLWLQGQCADLEFQGLQLKHGHAVRLNHVYVPLTTSAGGEATPEERRAERLMREKPRLLLALLGRASLYVSGAPGSGKSMFCRWVAWLACSGAMPRHEVEAPEGYAETLDASLQDRLPLLVRLRDFWPFLPTTPGLHELSQAELEKALSAWVQAKLPADLAWTGVRPHIERGSALLIIDGVDEVPLSQGEGRQVSHPRQLLLAGLGQAIPEWVRLGNRVLLTSRPYGLSAGEAVRLGLAEAPVEDLADEAQTLLARRWFHALAEDRAAAETTAREMIEHVREREWLESLIGNPMLLTAMCILYGEGKRLPQDKYDLYARIVENVLHNRYAADPAEIELVRSRLSVIAHGMHTGAGLGEARATPQAEATYDEIDQMIRAYREQSAWTEAGFKGVVEAREDLLSRSGLLLPRGDRRAGFYHLSFQDFLAAQRLLDLEGDRLADALRERAAAPEWRPALSFVFGSLLAKSTSPEPGIRLLTRLIELAAPEELGLHVVVGECIEMLIGRGIRLQPAVEDLARRFCLAAIEREAPLRERHALGLTLGRLGDPRIVHDLRERSAYQQVQAGSYVLGEERRRFTLERSFLMSRYLVTNSQYDVFVKEGGYKDARWWSPEGHRWLAESGTREPEYWRRGTWNNPSQPVVGVSFWEAEAFSAWVGGRLPTEHEWECAARGPEGYEYPWGNEWEDGICNTREARLGATSAVGLFPRSRSKAFGLEDMAGNVWEWCGDIFEAERAGETRGRASRPTRRGMNARAVLRGGSWNGVARVARSAFRDVYLPVFRDYLVGFRVGGAGGVRTP